MTKKKKKKGKNKKKKPKNDNCPRCKGNREITLIETLKNGGTREVTERCDLCYGSGKKR